MDLKLKRKLGKSGLMAGRLGVASGYGAPAEAFEEAFERGCNYFFWGSLRRSNMACAIKNISAQGNREKLIVVIQVYNRIAGMIAGSVEKGLKKLGLDYADVLLLGWYNHLPSPRIIEATQKIKASGKIKFLAMSGHNRSVFPVAAEKGVFDILHVRYNAAHRGVETDVFPKLPKDGRPGIVTYTATRWGQLLKSGKMPAGEKTPRASDCYRFVLSNPDVDVCLTGPKDSEQMREALRTLELGPLNDEEKAWMMRVGDHLHGK
jgi:aryl-alcohol dehydrogenase-like predicted oxidoreductase